MTAAAAPSNDGGSSSYQSVDKEERKNSMLSVEIESSFLHNKNSEQEHTLNNHGTIPPPPVVEEEEVLVLSIEDAVERLGMGRFQYKILVAAGLCFAADSMEILLLSFLAIVLRQEWNLSDDETSSITSVVFLGAMIGTLVLGPLGDYLGRRPIVCCAATIISAFGMATALATNYIQLLIMRFFVGVGVGGLTVPFDTLAEFLPTSKRGKNLLYIEYFWTAGTLSVPIVAYITLDIYSSWQWFVFWCAVPCVTSAVLSVWFVPESPQWLCATGQSDKALAVLRRAAFENGLDADWLFPPHTILRQEVHEEQHSTVFDLLSPRWRRLTLTLWGTWIGFAFGYYGTILAITQVFDESNSDDDSSRRLSSENGGTYDFDYLAIFKSGAGEVLGTTMVILTIDRVGRVPSQVVSYAMGGLCVFGMCLLAQQGQDHHYASLVVLAFLARSFEMSGTCVTWVSTAELLTTEIRTSGHSAANAVARMGGFASPFLVQQSTSLVTIGIVMLCTHAFTMLCALQLPETKGLAMGTAGLPETRCEDIIDHELITTTSNGDYTRTITPKEGEDTRRIV